MASTLRAYFEQDRQTSQCTNLMTSSSRGVARCGIVEGAIIGLGYGPKVVIDLVDAAQVGANEVDAGEGALGEAVER